MTNLKVNSCLNKEIQVLRGGIYLNLYNGELRQDTEIIEESLMIFASATSLIPYVRHSEESQIEEGFIGTRSPISKGLFSDDCFEPNQFFPMDLTLIDSTNHYLGSLAEIAHRKLLGRQRLCEIVGSNIIYEASPAPEDVVVSNHETFGGFLTILGFIANHASFVQDLFNRKSEYNDGKVEIKLFLDGQWISNVVDDRVPVSLKPNNPYIEQEVSPRTSKSKQSLSLCCHAQKNKSWVSLIQKAYAKAFGNYLNIAGPIDPEKALRDLTGCPTYRRSFCSESRIQDFLELSRYAQGGYLILFDTQDLNEEQEIQTKLTSFSGYKHITKDTCSQVYLHCLRRIVTSD